MITYRELLLKSVAIKRSRKSVGAYKCTSQSQTHTGSRKDLHFSAVTLQRIKSLVNFQDFLALTEQASLYKHAKDRISIVRLGFLTKT